MCAKEKAYRMAKFLTSWSLEGFNVNDCWLMMKLLYYTTPTSRFAGRTGETIVSQNDCCSCMVSALLSLRG
jgi:hypothetical protein